MGTGLFDDLFDDRIALSFGLINEVPSDVVFDVEAQCISAAVEKRRREFAAGRWLARKALSQFGRDDVAIPFGADRAPIWPEGIVGSISHTDTLCAAAVAETVSGIAAVGIDVELAKPLAPDLWETVLSEDERLKLPVVSGQADGLLEMIVFSAKEAAYKCQYPLSGVFLEFTDLTVSLNVDRMTFEARFMRDARPFYEGEQLQGRWRVADGHIATAVALDSVREP